MFEDLLVLRSEEGLRRIKSVQEWMERKAATQQIILDLLGAFPASYVPLDMTVLAESDQGNYIRKKISFTSEHEDRIPSYLLVPKQLTQPRPAVVCIHQTTPQGKDEPAGISGKEELFYAHHLADRGYITIAPDLITAGERVYPGLARYNTEGFYRRHPDWSALGKIIWDVRRSVDLLCTLDEVDKTRIGCIGHSLGGHSAFFAAAFDERIKATVSNCGLYPFQGEPYPFIWSRKPRLNPNCDFIYIPKLRNFLSCDKKPPFDMHEVIALIAPRAFYNSSSIAERMGDGKVRVTRERLEEVYIRVREVYTLLGAEDKLEFYLFEDGHTFPSEAREKAYAWLDRWLKNPI